MLAHVHTPLSDTKMKSGHFRKSVPLRYHEHKEQSNAHVAKNLGSKNAKTISHDECGTNLPNKYG